MILFLSMKKFLESSGIVHPAGQISIQHIKLHFYQCLMWQGHLVSVDPQKWGQ